MKKTILLPVFILLLLLACGQENDKPDAISSKKTNIPSTRVYIHIPEGFHISERIIGLEKNENVVISITDLIGGNFYKNAVDVNKKNFEKMGVLVKSYEELKVEGFPAKKVHYKNEEQEGYFLVFGDSTFSTTITGMVYSNDTESLRQVEKCISNISYDKSLSIDPLAFAKFKLNTEKSAYKFLNSSAGMYTYTLKGREIDSFDNESIFMVGQLPYFEKEITLEALNDQIFMSRKNNGLHVTDIIYEEIIVIDGSKAYEIIADGLLNNKKVRLYSLVIAKGNNAFSCSGIAKNNFETNMEEYIKLARSFQFKY